ncbi:NADPH-dependent 2,4-dienoyl-CoA reductase/sulfur reductase-like enzyme/rhodanese-related sulfurtransferase [Aurantimicrobium minutum]|uniref:FAD-dependent oxidoreductase n=1 Tax=Aurantimicrobium minutum TaxID=708131 RepID=UPI002473A1CC|nr:FAD-dependent oxidoreductase [Aurantimicrobium minutum]MDH6207679.1 NADPH-dependent 2,4-dienoyl-CoA reductase/sulfur reductase-like enzyme/rhodanese-related sulfurtransferase [Aurantimicrobium minutum]MDH6424636.1 NADPH-dependent 2,4-dienoyl-CoA reductase/sulfur reductase-like enzyme/rhodanese-related sulfurtransferase [Aurantimicrobium minutum]
MVRPKKIVVIGGVAGGMSAATRLRRLDEQADIVVLERSGYVSFANCGLPYHLSGTIEQRSSLMLQTPASLAARFALDVRVKSEAVEINRDAKTVIVRNLETKKEYVESYDFLILSPGAAPVMPGQPGAERAMSMRDIEDLDRAMAWLESKPTTALVLGGGFIGIEVAENLVKRGIQVTLLQRGNQLMKNLDPEMAVMLTTRMRAAGVDLRFNTTAREFTKKTVTLSTGEEISADVIFSAMGVRPEIGLAQLAGLRIGENGGIWVDAEQRTSDPSIFAVGDAAEKTDSISGEPRLATLAGLANRHGHSVANAIAQAPVVPATPALGTSIVTFEGLAAASVGWTETALRAESRNIRIVHAHPANHAAYYPGAETMRLKLIVDADTDKILGAQGVGGSGVDKRIDVIATAMFAGITASNLAQLELAYDPQHGSAKDPVNMLGYINRNIAEGFTRTIEWHQLELFRNEGWEILDVRTVGEHKFGAMPESINIPLDTLRENLEHLRGKKVVVHCQVGQRGHTATRILTQEGVEAVNLDGGYLTWKAGMASKGDQK